MSELKAVVFDIDGTLTPENSWLLFTRDIGGSVAEHLAIYEDHLGGGIGLDESKRRLLEMWQATGKANKPHIEKAFENWPIRKEAYELVDWLQHHNYSICLITGSVGIYAQDVAQRLGIDHYYANAELHFDESGDLVDFDYTTDQASVKLRQFGEFCTLMSLKAEECVPVGDGNNDIGLFQVTGNGILVDHDKVAGELRAAAWKTVASLSEIPALIEARK